MACKTNQKGILEKTTVDREKGFAADTFTYLNSVANHGAF